MNNWYKKTETRNENKSKSKAKTKNKTKTKKTETNDILNSIVSKGHKQLINNNTQMEQLKERRGLTENTIKSAKLCYINKSLIKEIENDYSAKKLVNSGLWKYECKLCENPKTFTSKEELEEHIEEHHQYSGNAKMDWVRTLLPEEGIGLPYLNDEKPVYINVRKLSPEENENKYVRPHSKNVMLYRIGKGNQLFVTEGEFDALSVYQDKEDTTATAISGVGTSSKVYSQLSKIARQKKSIIYSADNDVPGLEAIAVVTRNLQERGVKIQVSVGSEKDLSNQLAENGEISLDPMKPQEVLLQNYKKLLDNENQLNFVNSTRDLFYISLAGLKESKREQWLKKLKGVLKDLEDTAPRCNTLYREARKFIKKQKEIKGQEKGGPSGEPTPEFTEGAETPESSEQDSLVNCFLSSVSPHKVRLSGKLDKDTYFHTIFGKRGEKYYPLVVTNNDVKPVRNRMEVSDEEDPEKDYYFFKYGGEEYRFKHEIPAFPELDIYRSDNRIFEFFQGREPRKEVFDRIKEKIRKYWDHYSSEWFTVLSAWVIHTYLLDGIGHTPYLMFKGKEDTGKSTAQKILARLSYNGYFTGKSTGPSTSRIAHYTQATLHLDEWEKSSNEEIEGVFNTGQRKGAKYTFTDMSKDDIKNQIQALFSYCAKSLSVNSLTPFDSHFISRNIIIEATRTKRSLKPIENIHREEEREFTDIRNESLVYCLFNWKKIIGNIEKYKEEMDISGREADKISIISGIVRHFKGEEKANEIERFLKDMSGGEEESIQKTEKVLFEKLIDEFGDEREIIRVQPGELAEHINDTLNLDEYKWRPQTVTKKLKKHDIVRNPQEQKSRSGAQGQVEYELQRSDLIDSFTRYGLYTYRDRLTTKSEEKKEKEGTEDKIGNNHISGSVSSGSSAPSVGSSRNGGVKLKEKIKDTIEEHSDSDGLCEKADIFFHLDEDEDKIREALEKMERDGEIYSPKSGYIDLV